MTISKSVKLFLGIILSCFVLSQPAVAGVKGAIGKKGIALAKSPKTKVYLSQLSQKSRNKLNILHKKPVNYEFITANGKRYIGQTNNFQRRMKEHVRSGKLSPKNLNSIQHKIINYKQMRNIDEKVRVKTADIIGNFKKISEDKDLANIIRFRK